MGTLTLAILDGGRGGSEGFEKRRERMREGVCVYRQGFERGRALMRESGGRTCVCVCRQTEGHSMGRKRSERRRDRIQRIG